MTIIEPDHRAGQRVRYRLDGENAAILGGKLGTVKGEHLGMVTVAFDYDDTATWSVESYNLEPAPGEPAPVDLVGQKEIAERLGVAFTTCKKWRQRGLLPEPEWNVSSTPVWRWEVIAEWARTRHPG